MVTGSWNSSIDILVYHLLLPDYSFPTACIRNTITAFFWGSYAPKRITCAIRCMAKQYSRKANNGRKLKCTIENEINTRLTLRQVLFKKE